MLVMGIVANTSYAIDQINFQGLYLGASKEQVEERLAKDGDLKVEKNGTNLVYTSTNSTVVCRQKDGKVFMIYIFNPIKYFGFKDYLSNNDLISVLCEFFDIPGSYIDVIETSQFQGNKLFTYVDYEFKNTKDNYFLSLTSNGQLSLLETDSYGNPATGREEDPQTRRQDNIDILKQAREKSAKENAIKNSANKKAEQERLKAWEEKKKARRAQQAEEKNKKR